MLGFGKKRSIMELQNLQEALKVEIQIHQVSPPPSIWIECVIVAAAVPSTPSRGHCIGMCHPLLRVLKLSSLSCRNSWARWSKIHRCVSLTEHVPHLRYCLIDTLSYTGHWTSVLGRSVCVLCTECRSEAAAPWPAGQDHSAEWAAGESCSLREHLLPYQCSLRTYTCLDQFNYLGSESLYLLVCPEKMRRSCLVMKPVLHHGIVLCCIVLNICGVICAVWFCVAKWTICQHTNMRKSILPLFFDISVTDD